MVVCAQDCDNISRTCIYYLVVGIVRQEGNDDSESRHKFRSAKMIVIKKRSLVISELHITAFSYTRRAWGRVGQHCRDRYGHVIEILLPATDLCLCWAPCTLCYPSDVSRSVWPFVAKRIGLGTWTLTPERTGPVHFLPLGCATVRTCTVDAVEVFEPHS